MCPFECLILLILTMTKYHKNLLSDSPLSLIFIVNFFSSLETKTVLKIPNRTFLRITLYITALISTNDLSFFSWFNASAVFSNFSKNIFDSSALVPVGTIYEAPRFPLFRVVNFTFTWMETVKSDQLNDCFFLRHNCAT